MSTTKNNSAEIDGVCDNMLHNMSTTDNEDGKSVCANCGKEGSDVTNICNKCKSVKYCNAACKKKHRHKHKKECERRVAELHDEQLFKQPPPEEDCPICFLRLPSLLLGRVYMACCGKLVCRGCNYAVYESERETATCKLCPFCRTPPPSSHEETIKRYKKRVYEDNDVWAMHSLGYRYSKGDYGLPINHTKALKLWQQAAKLGHTNAYYSIGCAYRNGRGVERDAKKAEHYCELAALGGCEKARYNLGAFEKRDGNHHRALKHFMIAAGDGDHNSLKAIQGYYMNGHATKEDYAKALRSYQAYLDEIRSDQRDEAAAARDEYKYYYSAF